MTKYSEVSFYRAFSKDISSGEYENIFKDGSRKPKDMPLAAHHILDNWFQAKFGVKARSSTIFVGVQKESVIKYAQEVGNVIKNISFPLGSIYIYIYIYIARVLRIYMKK